MTLAPSLVDLLQAFDLPSRLVAGEECLGNGGEVRAGRGLEFHRSGPIYCELDQRRSRTGLAGPALSFCGISCRSILLRKSRRGGMADAEDLKSSGRERPCGFDRGPARLGKPRSRGRPWPKGCRSKRKSKPSLPPIRPEWARWPSVGQRVIRVFLLFGMKIADFLRQGDQSLD